MATRRYYSAIAVDNTLASSINNSVTSLTLNASPVGLPGSFPYALAVDYDTSSEELVLVTAASGSTLTITRAFNGTAAQAHNAGATVRHVIAAQDLTDFQDHAAAGPNGVHGITGALGTFLTTPTSTTLASLISDETGSGSLVFGTSPVLTTPKSTIGFNAQTGTSYTLVATDQDTLVTLNNASAITLTVPPSIFTAGMAINIQQLGAGQVTVAAGSGVTITGTGTKLSKQYSAAVILCTASNAFTLIGDIA
jgi:hypothetical protein